ncbi:unnamed protein product, partial [Amoebophrya sp. A120]
GAGTVVAGSRSCVLSSLDLHFANTTTSGTALGLAPAKEPAQLLTRLPSQLPTDAFQTQLEDEARSVTSWAKTMEHELNPPRPVAVFSYQVEPADLQDRRFSTR